MPPSNQDVRIAHLAHFPYSLVTTIIALFFVLFVHTHYIMPGANGGRGGRERVDASDAKSRTFT